MSYITQEELVGRYGEFLKIGGDADVTSHHIAGAERKLNSMLGTVFTVPFSSNNLTAKELTIQLTYVQYWESRKPEKVEETKKSLFQWIDDLRNGLASMDVGSGDGLYASSANAPYSSTSQYHPTFGHGDIENMIVDPDLIDAESDARD